MTRNALASALRALHAHMHATGLQMRLYAHATDSPDRDEIAEHALELLGAAAVVQAWAHGIEGESCPT